MNRYVEQVHIALAATRIHSATSYSWNGQRSPRLPGRVTTAFSSDSVRAYLVSSLQSMLYSEFYCRGGRVGDPGPAPRPTPGGRTPFVEELSHVNSGTGYVDRDWSMRRAEHDRAVLRKRGLDIWVGPEDWDTESGRWPRAGEKVGVRFPKENLASSPGFYVALGDLPFSSSSEVGVRIYWNLRPKGAVLLVRAVTLLLNRARVPFQVKVLQDPGRFARADAGVLYLGRSDLLAQGGALTEIHATVASHLCRRCPAFTRMLAPGVGLAEDPGGGDSFGMNRCGLLAEGIVRAHESKRRSLTNRAESVAAVFTTAGVDLDKPYLRPGSTDPYTL